MFCTNFTNDWEKRFRNEVTLSGTPQVNSEGSYSEITKSNEKIKKHENFSSINIWINERQF